MTTTATCPDRDLHGNVPADSACHTCGWERTAAPASMRDLLAAAVARVELANADGNPILSAWLPEARAAIAADEGAEACDLASRMTIAELNDAREVAAMACRPDLANVYASEIAHRSLW